MDRAYISRGLRWSAQELATERLGPRLEVEIRRTPRARDHPGALHVARPRARARRARAPGGCPVAGRAAHGPERALLVRRLEHLENLGLAEKVAPSGWVLAEGWHTHLRDLGQRGDILKQMHRVMSGADPARFHVVRPGQALPDGHGGVDERVLVGRVVRKGLADELKGRTFYAVVETPTGDAYHVTVGAREADALRVGDLVSFATKREAAVQPVDRTIAEVAAARGGVYELAGNADGQDAAARTAARRLRELERLGVVTAEAPGRWHVPSDLCAQLEKRHREAPSRYRLSLEPLPLSLDAQVGREGPVWLDTVDPARLATKGFGAEVLVAIERRRQALRELGIAPDDPERDAKVRGLERRAVGRDIARQTGQQFLESIPSRFRGRLQSAPEDAPYLAVTDGARFVLIAATPQTRSRTGQTIDLARDASGRVLLAEDPARAVERLRSRPPGCRRDVRAREPADVPADAPRGLPRPRRGRAQGIALPRGHRRSAVRPCPVHPGRLGAPRQDRRCRARCARSIPRTSVP